MNDTPSEALINEMLSHFKYKGKLKSVDLYTEGHINDSYAVVTSERKYFLQRINPAVFKEPVKVMKNIILVTGYLQKVIIDRGGDPDEECPTLVETIDGEKYSFDKDGNVWRLYLFVDGMVYDIPKNEEVFGKAGEAFGRFQHELSHFPAGDLFEVIPHFHDTPRRFAGLEKAIEANKAGRAESAKEEIEFALSKRDRISVIVDSLKDGSIPRRVTHNDTKLNNIMFDENGENPRCVLDLDTMMVGSSLYDFGDAIRYGANTAAEDEKDLSKIAFSLPMFEAYAKGFLNGAEGSITKKEITLFPYSARLLTYECGIRFLSDYLDGDHYFHVDYPTHNLVRARDQFTLVKDMERKQKEAEAFIDTLL